MKNKRLLKIDADTLEKFRKLSFELSVIEGKKVSMGDIPDRLLGSEDIIERLKIGAKERRLGLK